MKKRQANGKLQLMVNVIRELRPADVRAAAGGDQSLKPNCTGLSTQCGKTFAE